jgi:hypothetical protein
MHFARTLSVAFLLSGFFPLLANAEEGMPAFNTEAPAYKALEFTEVKQNKIGYHPKAPKLVWVKVKSTAKLNTELEGLLLQIRPIVRDPSLNFTELVKDGHIVARPSVDRISTDLALVDLSKLRREGRFHFYPFGQFVQRRTFNEFTGFNVNANVFQFVGQAATRALFTQRSGQSLLDGGIGFFQEAGHIDNGLPMGGWYEGATYDRHMLSHVMVASTLMTIYERNPVWSQKRGRLAYPQSEDTSSGVPDLLHEARYGLRWILEMQEMKGKGFFEGIGSPAPFDGVRVRPEFDRQTRKLLPPSQISTAAAVATLAQAARVFQDMDPDLALSALIQAKEAWNALEGRRIKPVHSILEWQGEKELYTQAIQPYFRESYWSHPSNSADAYILWAALELGHTTGNLQILKVADALWDKVNVNDLSWQSPLYRLWTSPALKGYIPEGIKSQWVSDAKNSREWTRALQTPFVNPFDFKDFPVLPASNDAWVRHALLWMDAYDVTKDPAYLKSALDVFNYLMGFNTWDAIMMSGNPALGNLPLQKNPCNQVARSSGAVLPGLLLKGVTPQFPDGLPFQDNSTLCQWTATHISWQAHLADLMFRLDQQYSPELSRQTVIKSTDKDFKKLKLYNDVEQEEIRLLKEQKEKKSSP